MIIECIPAPLSGRIPAIPSKSDAHRLLILAAFSDRETTLLLPSLSKDIEATMECLRSLGAKIEETIPGEYLISPVSAPAASPVLNCGESGSTLRFLLPVAMAVADQAAFCGAGRLPERPLSPLKEEMERHGCTFLQDKLPLTVAGRLTGHDFSLAGNVSSQFLSGILMALPLLGGGTLSLTTDLESEGYVDITLSAMARFGVAAERTANGWRVPSARYRSPGRIAAEGDWSNAAFWLTAGILSGGVEVTGLDPASPQGDKAILEILSRMGAELSVSGGVVSARPSRLHGAEIDVRQTPDLVPILCIAAGAAQGVTRIFNAARLRIKESDRLSAMARALSALGVQTEELPDALVIHGNGGFTGGSVNSENDHRIAMSAAVAAVKASGSVTIADAQAAEKSYPRFYDDYQALGGNVHVL